LRWETTEGLALGGRSGDCVGLEDGFVCDVGRAMQAAHTLRRFMGIFVQMRRWLSPHPKSLSLRRGTCVGRPQRDLRWEAGVGLEWGWMWGGCGRVGVRCKRVGPYVAVWGISSRGGVGKALTLNPSPTGEGLVLGGRRGTCVGRQERDLCWEAGEGLALGGRRGTFCWRGAANGLCYKFIAI
jgi:hypothetical protein